MPRLRAFLCRLCRDDTANALTFFAAALIPMIAVIGSGVDVSRAYMAKSKMQSACDSAALASRRVMQSDTLSEDAIATGTSYFEFNFPDGLYGTESFEPVITRPEAGIVRIEAETTIPTTIMDIFGFSELPVIVSCDASLNFVNTDVVLILDVTGSMADPVDGVSKIVTLREAVLALYDELEPVQTQLQAQGLRLRYGIVPYSSTVNVGRLLYAVDPTYIRSSITVPSRTANFTTNSGTPTTTTNAPTSDGGSWQIASSSLNTTDCQTYVNAADTTGGGPIPTATTATRYDGSSTDANYVQSVNYGWSGAPDTSGTSRSCRRWRTITTTTYTAVYPRKAFTNWTYRHETYDTSTFKTPSGSMLLASDANGTVSSAGGSFNAQQLAASGTGVTTTSVSWNGCIEERETSTTIDGGTSLVIPAAAKDLDINLLPSSDATRWSPQLPEVIYTRTAGSTSASSTGSSTSTTNWIKNYLYTQGYWACPTEARRLAEWDRDDLVTYTNLLQPIGGTYHDIGMIWGARMVSTGGVFGDGCTFYNDMPCNRHIIFMTDGQQTAYCNVLTAYGVEQNDLRTTGSGSCPSQLARHEQRFRMMCNAAKNMGVSLWVIGFDTALNSNLSGCASNAAQASTTSDRDDLIARFREIGNEIGALRLTR